MLDLEMIGEGATTKVYRDGDRAIKLYVNAPPNEAANEAKLQAFAFQSGLPVPAVYGIRKLDETMTALDMAYIPGEPLLNVKMDKDRRLDAIHTLVKLQCMVHTIKADGLPKQTDRLAWKIDRNDYLERSLKGALFTLLNSFDPSFNSLCHGDFHPLNILFDGSKYWIIDWVDATSGNPLADACRTYLLFKQFISRSSGIYLRLFCREADVKQEDVLKWLPVITAARMTENMDEKTRNSSLSIIEDWYKAQYQESH